MNCVNASPIARYMPIGSRIPRFAKPAKRYKEPKWESALCEAIRQAVIDQGAYETSSAARGNLICTAEFELPGWFQARYESRPSSRYWGHVEVSVVISPRHTKDLSQRPGEVLPFGSWKAARQGDATASVFIPWCKILPARVALVYVSGKFQREWRNVCGL